MDPDLTGRHVVVTGGGSGIGAAIAARLAESGAAVTLIARCAGRLEQMASRLAKAQAIAADVADAQAITGAFAQARTTFGPVTILVNNAGVAPSAPFLRTTPEIWASALGVNLTGAFHCAQAALPDMLESGWGRVINIASTAGLKGYAYVSAYCAAKHGLIGLTRSLALEVARKGVTVNAVCPGYTETDIVHEAIDNIVQKTGRSADEARAELTRNNPQGRLIAPDEVAATVSWLCSGEARSITGQAIAVAGGEVM